MDRSERDADLNNVLIGGLERRPIVIVDYDPDWPVRFVAQRDRIQRALGPLAMRIEHIGSTAVPGLAAKPVIDMLVTVADPDGESVMVPAMASAGYHVRVRETGHWMFRTPDRDAHVHVWGDSDAEVSRYLRFRDRLRASPEDRRAYERLKRELSARDWQDMNHYADAKKHAHRTDPHAGRGFSGCDRDATAAFTDGVTSADDPASNPRSAPRSRPPGAVVQPVAVMAKKGKSSSSGNASIPSRVAVAVAPTSGL